MGKRRLSSHSANDEITTRGYRILTSIECITIMIVELAAISGLGSSLD
jgi:DNA integrity scanning protein DisA with diadenylate cyclase activity